jgi:hypothetical protein
MTTLAYNDDLDHHGMVTMLHHLDHQLISTRGRRTPASGSYPTTSERCVGPLHHKLETTIHQKGHIIPERGRRRERRRTRILSVTTTKDNHLIIMLPLRLCRCLCTRQC